MNVDKQKQEKYNLKNIDTELGEENNEIPIEKINFHPMPIIKGSKIDKILSNKELFKEIHNNDTKSL